MTGVDTGMSGGLVPPGGPILPPKTQHDSTRAVHQMVEIARARRLQMNAEFGAHLEQQGVAAQAAMTQQAEFERQQDMADLQHLADQMLVSDMRDLGVRGQMGEQISTMAGRGADPGVVEQARGELDWRSRLSDAFSEDMGRVEGMVQEYADRGLLPSVLAALASGGAGGASLGAVGGQSTPERAYDDLEQVIRHATTQRFPNAGRADDMGGMLAGVMPTAPYGTPARNPAERAAAEARSLEGVIDEETYVGELRRQSAKLMESRAEEIEEGMGERVARGMGEIVGMAMPLGASVKVGQKGAQALTGAARKLFGQGAGKGLMEAGVATSKLGKFLQTAGGMEAALFTAGIAKPLHGDAQAYIDQLPEDERADAEVAWRTIEGGRLALTGPLMMLSGALSRGAKTMLGKSGVAASTFQVGGEAMALGEEALFSEIGEDSDTIRRMVEFKLLANPEMRGPLTRVLEASAQRDFRGVMAAMEDLTVAMGSGFLGFATLNALHMFPHQRRDPGFQKTLTDATLRAHAEVKEMADNPNVQRHLGRLIDQRAEELRPSARERETAKVMAEVEKLEPGRSQAEVEKRIAARRVEGEAETLEGRMEELAAQRNEIERAIESGEGNVSQQRDVQRLEAAEEFLRITELSTRQTDAGVARELRQQAEAFREQYEALSQGQAAGVPGVAEFQRMGLRGESLDMARELRMQEQGLEVARQILRGAQEGPAVAPRETTAERMELPQPSESRWRPPESPEQVGAQVGAMESLRVRASEVDYAALEAMPGKKAERVGAIEKLPEELREDAQKAVTDFPSAGGPRIAAETLYNHLRRTQGMEPARVSAGGEVERMARELDLVGQSPSAEAFLAWSRARHEQLNGPLGEVLERWGPGREIVRRMVDMRERLVLNPANSHVSPQAMGILPWSSQIEGLRAAMNGDARRAATIDRWTAQTSEGLLSERFMRDWKWPKVRVPGTKLEVPRVGIPTLTSFAARLTKVFEHPISEYGKAAVDMGMLRAKAKYETDLTLKALFDPAEGILASRGIAESVIPKRGGGEAKRAALKFNPAEPAHQVGRLLEVPRSERAESEVWRDAPANVREAAQMVDDMVLEPIRQAAARSTKQYIETEQEIAQSLAIQKDAKAEVARMEQRAAELDAEALRVEGVAAGRTALKDARTRLSDARKRKEALTRQRKRAEGRGEDTAPFDDAEVRREIRGIERDVRIWERSETELLEKAGVEPASRLTRAIRSRKADVTFQHNRQQKLRDRLVDIENAWGIDGYMPHIPAVAIDHHPSSEVMRSQDPNLWFQVSHTKKRTGGLKKSGNYDPDAVRALRAYVPRMMEFIHTQQWHRMHGPDYYGRWEVPTARDIAGGVDPSAKGPNHEAVIKVNSLVGDGYAPGRFDQLLGAYARTEAGGFEKATGGRKQLLAWRGEGPLRLEDAEWVAAQEKAGHLLAIPTWKARRAVQIERGGFKRLADDSRKSSMEEYLQLFTRAYRETSGVEDPISFLGRWHGSKTLKAMDNAARRVAYMASTNVLGWWNHEAVMNAGMGALFLNQLLLGPKRAATGVGHWMDYLNRVKNAGIEPTPGDQVLEAGGGPTEPIRQANARKLRLGKDEVLDDAMEWFHSSGLLTNTKSIDSFSSQRRFEPALTPKGAKGDYRVRQATRPSSAREAASVAGGRVVEAGWGMFGTMESAVRAGLAIDTYVTMRRAGRTHREAADKATQVTVLAHGVFNPMLRSRFFRSGIGQAAGTVNTWVSQFIGVINRLPPKERRRVWVGVMAASALAAHWGENPLKPLGLDPEVMDGWDMPQWVDKHLGTGAQQDISRQLGSNLRDVPVAGEFLNYAAKENPAYRWLSGMLETDPFPGGIPVPAFVTQADSPLMDTAEGVVDALGMAVQGRGEAAGKKLWQTVGRIGLPRTIEIWRKAFDTEELPDGGYEYVPLTSENAQILREHGLSQVLQGFWPGTPIYRAAEQDQASREAVAQQIRADKKADARREIRGAMEQRLRLDRTGATGPAVDARREEQNERLRRQMAKLEELGEPISQRSARDLGKQAKMRSLGMRDLQFALSKAASKAAEVETLVRWLENDSIEIDAKRFGEFMQLHSGQQSVGAWLADSEGGVAKVPLALQRRFQEAVRNRFSQR